MDWLVCSAEVRTVVLGSDAMVVSGIVFDVGANLAARALALP